MAKPKAAVATKPAAKSKITVALNKKAASPVKKAAPAKKTIAKKALAKKAEVPAPVPVEAVKAIAPAKKPAAKKAPAKK